MKDMNLVKLIDTFHSEDRCRERLEELRWPDGPQCPRCGSPKHSRIRTRNLFECGSCEYHYSVTVGTILQDSHLPLRKWFLAAYLMIEAKKGISALQLKRTLNVSYKTAWYLSHRLRAAMRDAYPFPLKGIVVGAVQRGGKIVLQVADSNDRQTLHGFIRQNTDPETEAIYTDEWAAYRGIGDEDTRHETVNHRAEEWVRGEVHTNTVEGVWSLFKRSLIGSFHRVSVKHLDAYLDELEWRFNNRDNPYLFRDTLIRLLTSGNLEYKTLTR
jgi:transposase-like protein